MLNDMVVLYLVFKGTSILLLKKSKIMLFAATWMDLEIIILSEASQTEKDKYIIYIWTLIKMTHACVYA